MSVSHVIFDFDGVLIDSEKVYSDVNNRLLSRFGKTFTLGCKIKMMGAKKSEAVKILLADVGLDNLITPEEYLKDYDPLLVETLSECDELPGASKLIDYFYEHQIPMGICTGSDTKEFETKTNKLYKHWLEKIPLQVLCGDDPEIIRGKPSPIPYQVTMKRMDKQPARPENTLVFEDSLNGAKSAIAAGCQTIMIPQRQFLNEDGLRELERIRSHLTDMLDSLEQFDPIKYGLPAFK